MAAAQGAALVDVLLLAGIVAAVLLADRVGRIRLQVLGFVGCAAGLALAALSTQTQGASSTFLVFAGFMLFNFMTNLGPNAMTYLLAGEVFPTRLRGRGAGLAASVAKVGAVTTAFIFPLLLARLGTGVLLSALVAASLAGAAVTRLFAIETKGLDLEEL
jgi:nitrate/nitrite transporter NarK